MRYFNTTGACDPARHYMVDLSSRLSAVTQMVDRGDYFTINRARQFGKTTILNALAKSLSGSYLVILTSFQRYSSAVFQDEATFSRTFLDDFAARIPQFDGRSLNEAEISDEVTTLDKAKPLDKAWALFLRSVESAKSAGQFNLTQLFRLLSAFCAQSPKPVVLIIDEVDQASDNQIFLDFLAQLRDYYLNRSVSPTFQSVILAGVYDIKNLKLKIRPDEEHRYNSPWNIAAPFDVDMSFSANEIAAMLSEYKSEHQCEMDCAAAASAIYDYTDGYPYLVSSLCKIADEQQLGWSQAEIDEAAGIFLRRQNTLFDDMVKHISEYPVLEEILRKILFSGVTYPYNYYNQAMNIATMFGFLKEEDGSAVVANRIFETFLYNYFLSEDLTSNLDSSFDFPERSQFLTDGQLDMQTVMEKFAAYFTDIFADSEERFIEDNGRRIFLMFLKPIINGSGNYYVEARTRNKKRTDLVIDYKAKQYVVEMKIWHGQEYNQRGEKQLTEYLDYFHVKTGYLLSFNFNKKKNPGVHTIRIGEYTIVEAVV